ncbi:MAG TPA: hypothetical protein VK200_02630, partial [Candidatus Limnocylindrales bacterium]|nr:hypothetical protein [Candidatus Limnocylindrales bacterium]
MIKQKTFFRSLTVAVSVVALIVGLAVNARAQKQAVTDRLDRTVLPIPEPQPPTITELDARNVK